jgi:hypothetical protein
MVRVPFDDVDGRGLVVERVKLVVCSLRFRGLIVDCLRRTRTVRTAVYRPTR